MIRDESTTDSSHHRLMAKQHKQAPTMEQFLRTIPNGQAVHLSIHNVAVAGSQDTLKPTGEVCSEATWMLAPAVLRIGQQGHATLTLGSNLSAYYLAPI